MALVTGGGQGLGRAFCHALAGAGARVIVADINEKTAAHVASEVVNRDGSATALPVDVADEGSVAALASAAGPVDILVNAAAIFSTLRRRPFTEITVAEWDAVMAVNVRGMFLMCRALAPGMGSRGYGKIVNISSGTIWSGRPFYLHYVTSKAAVVGLTRALANELGPSGVRVNAITPGATRTEVARETVSEKEWKEMVAHTALRRQEVSADLVGAVVFLSSPASDFITGQTLNVDGGVDYH